MSEHAEQVALFAWKATFINQIPELEMLYAVPNGGHRHKATAARMKAEGQEPGVWDVSLDVPRAGYHGLKIEMKFGKNKLTDNQREWQERYERYGYKTVVCYSWLEARDAILDYLAGARIGTIRTASTRDVWLTNAL